MDNLTALGARDDLRELAEHYETITALDLTPEPGGAHGTPGSRLPPGMQEILDTDEVKGGLSEVDEWATFCCHVLTEENIGLPVYGYAPGKLRLIGDYADHFLGHPDEMLALAFQDDLYDHLRQVRRLARRGTRLVRTGMDCQDPTCTGHYAATVGTTNDSLTCDRCRHEVPYTVWSSWPRARVTYVTVEHAARIAGTTVAGVKMRASRGQWRRTGEGRDVRYHIGDVRGNTSA